jgi:hypothetical protein
MSFEEKLKEFKDKYYLKMKTVEGSMSILELWSEINMVKSLSENCNLEHLVRRLPDVGKRVNDVVWIELKIYMKDNQ